MIKAMIFVVGVVIGIVLGMVINESKVNNHVRGNVAVYYIRQDDERYMMLEVYPGKAALLDRDDTLFKIKHY